MYIIVVVVQSLSHVQLFVTPYTLAYLASLSFTISWKLLEFKSIELVMLSNEASQSPSKSNMKFIPREILICIYL